MVVQPVERQSPEVYVDLFKKIFTHGQPIKLSSKYYLRMMSLNIINDDYLAGTFVKYQDQNEDEWYNSETNSFQNVDLDKNLHPDGKEILFYFFPSIHRLVVENYLTTEQVRFYFDKYLTTITEGSGISVVFNIVKSDQGISSIVSNKHLTKLEISISYTNSDIYDGWERLLDESSKKTNVTNLKLTATGRADKPINVEENPLLMSALALSKDNGFAKAVEQTEAGKKIISSDKSPENIGIKYPEGESFIELLRNKLFGSVN